MRPIKIIKNRSDIGAGTRGSDLGIDAIEIAAINFNSDYFNRYCYQELETDNEAVYNKVKTTFAKRIAFVRTQCERVCAAVQQTMDSNYFPIILSGDHSSALGTISGIKTHLGNKRLGIAWVDAHADMHSPYTTPSGNVHGMPLAAALGEDNRKNQINEVTEFTEKEWNKMKNIGTQGPKFLPEDLVYFGVRDTEKPEDEIRSKLGLRKYAVHEVRYKGLDNVMDEVIEKLSHCDAIYISFDVDSLDCDLISKGTGTPVSKGFDDKEVTRIMNRLINTKKVACLEITEVNPLLDHDGNKMAETAFKVLSDVTKTLEKN